MHILITNDDGIQAPGLWELARQLVKVARVSVIAPDRPCPAIGTGLSLHRAIAVQPVTPEIAGVEAAYMVSGTPADCVLIGVDGLYRNGIDAVFSGINNGTNLGDDVFISGTVGAAIQAYLRGYRAVALSSPLDNTDSRLVSARLGAALAQYLATGDPEKPVLLNVNAPAINAEKIRGICLSSVAKQNYQDFVQIDKPGDSFSCRFIRERINGVEDTCSDASLYRRHYVSVTPLHGYLSHDIRQSGVGAEIPLDTVLAKALAPA